MRSSLPRILDYTSNNLQIRQQHSYMMMAQMMDASSQQNYTVNTELDKDRFYRAVLCGYED